MYNIAQTPIKVGPVTIKNRIVRTAHGTQFAKTGMDDDLIAYHRERARGGCALTIVENAAVHKSSANRLFVWEDWTVDGFRRLTEAGHEHDMKMFLQLWHGGNIHPALDKSAPLAASTMPGPLGVVGRRASRDDIAELVQAFRLAALRCREAGMDGVEVHAAHGYLFSQFLSSVHNDRDDEYGGSMANRARFLIETLRSIKDAVGNELAVGVRLSASSAPKVFSKEEVIETLELIQDQGLIDFVDVSFGDYYQMDNMVGGMHNPVGYELPYSAPVTARAKVPSIVAGRFRTLDEAETVLREGVADLVSMVRAHIVDPYIVEKSFSGRALEVRPCMGCNQGCGTNAPVVGRIGCTLNPSAGWEVTLAEKDLPITQRPRRVLVIGGGPAGMEAARTARLMGHEVILAEASSKLGGAARAASRGPQMKTFGDAIVWFEQEIFRLGVEVRFGSYLEEHDVRAINPDVVIIATGSMPRLDGMQIGDPGLAAPGCDLPHVISSNDLLTRTDLTATRTLILDTVGGYEGVCAMEQALHQGWGVTFVTHLRSLGPLTGRRGPNAQDQAASKDFELLLAHRLVEIKRDHVLVSPLYGGLRCRIEADLVVLITPNAPLNDLYYSLRDDFPDVKLVGDAARPRDMQYAIADGHRAARALG